MPPNGPTAVTLLQIHFLRILLSPYLPPHVINLKYTLFLLNTRVHKKVQLLILVIQLEGVYWTSITPQLKTVIQLQIVYGLLILLPRLGHRLLLLKWLLLCVFVFIFVFLLQSALGPVP